MKKHARHSPDSESKLSVEHSTNEQDDRLREIDEELITVILPTINNG